MDTPHTLDPATRSRVDRECLRLISRQALVTLPTTLAIAACLVYIMWPQVPHGNIYAWSASFLSVLAARSAGFFFYFRSERSLSTIAWRRIFEAGIFLAGVTWGLSALWLFPPSLLNQMFLACLMMGITSGATSSLSAFRSAFVLFLLPTVIPVATRAFLETDPAIHVGAIMAIFYMMGMTATAFNNHQMILRALALRFQNAGLVSDLQALARRDPLTGLANRLTLNEQLELALRRASRTKQNLAIMFIDCDAFKAINDSFGHGFGDEYLKLVSKALVSLVRSVDTVARLGGDEFIVLLEDCGDKANVARVAERLFRELSGGFQIGSVPLHPRVSVGISRYPDDATEGETLIQQADQAMYRVKQGGGNGFEFYQA